MESNEQIGKIVVTVYRIPATDSYRRSERSRTQKLCGSHIRACVTSKFAVNHLNRLHSETRQNQKEFVI